jgi:hypothetical protein
MPFRVSTSISGGALTVIVETAAAALEKVAELIELGHADVLVKDLDGHVVANALLETEAARSP